ncbi:MAG: DUF503 domain-containing protein [Planctomycetota bacterium]
MTVGVLRITMIVPGSRSLKEKRHALRSLKERIRHRFNVSIAEVEAEDLWQRAVLGVAHVANDADHVRSVLDEVANHCRNAPDAEFVDAEMELTNTEGE